MDYKINHLSSVEKELNVTFTSDEVASNLADSFKNLMKTANVKGFRPGKVPQNVVKQLYGKTVREDVEKYFISAGLQESITKENLRVIRYPMISDKSGVKDGQPFTFTFKVEVFPEVKIDNKNFEVEYSPIEFKNELLDEELTAVKKRFTEYKDAAREAKEADRVTVTFKGMRNGEVLDAASGENVPVILGDKNFIEDFEKSIYGKKAGDKYSVDVTFPEKYHSPELAGAVLTFDMEVIKIEEGSTPELTDELLSTKPDMPKTVEELKTSLKKRITDYINGINLENKRYILMDKFVQAYDFELPKSFLEAEIKIREEEYKKQHPGVVMPEETMVKITDDAKWVAKRFILLSQLAKDLQVSVSDEELDAELQKDADRYRVPVEYLKKALDENRLTEKRMTVQENKVIDKLMDFVKFNIKPAEEDKK